ncbi:hypothetical protein V7147_03205, partial [Bacillus sp. JJ1521]|uniref:hypothetical protein n=1 Tax=Bacillus sp. JJ1521 TaxID=3122957 RepID=UPI002FFDDD66
IEFTYAFGVGFLLIAISVLISPLANFPYKITLILSIGSMVLLYLIGYIANIVILLLKYTSTHAEISFLPIAVGLLIAIISDRIIKNKSKKS